MERIGWLDSCGDDFDVMLRIAKAFPVYRIDEVLSTTMIHSESFFSPTSLQKRVQLYQNTYFISRHHGGGVFTPIGVRYYGNLIMYRLGMEGYVPLAMKILSLLRKIVRQGGPNTKP
jgi:hypothetical protein